MPGDRWLDPPQWCFHPATVVPLKGVQHITVGIHRTYYARIPTNSTYRRSFITTGLLDTHGYTIWKRFLRAQISHRTILRLVSMKARIWHERLLAAGCYYCMHTCERNTVVMLSSLSQQHPNLTDNGPLHGCWLALVEYQMSIVDGHDQRMYDLRDHCTYWQRIVSSHRPLLPIAASSFRDFHGSQERARMRDYALHPDVNCSEQFCDLHIIHICWIFFGSLVVDRLDNIDGFCPQYGS